MTPAERQKKHRARQKERDNQLKTIIAGLKYMRKELNYLVETFAWPDPKMDGNEQVFDNTGPVFKGSVYFDEEEMRWAMSTVYEILRLIDKLVPKDGREEEELIEEVLQKPSPEHERKKEKSLQMIARNPDDIDAWFDLGVAKLNLEDFTGAKNDFEHALELSKEQKKPSFLPGIFFNLACANSRLEDISQAIDYLKKAIDADPKNKEIARSEPDFKYLRENPVFKSLIKQDSEEG